MPKEEISHNFSIVKIPAYWRLVVYIVRLTDEERQTLETLVKKLKGTSQKVKRAIVLLKADAHDPNWTHEKIRELTGLSIQAIVNIRKQLVLEGFDVVLDRKNDVCHLFQKNSMGCKKQNSYKRFPPEYCREILRRCEFVPTPVHGSWLNIAECELSVLTKQCLCGRIGSIDEVRKQVAAWMAWRNEHAKGIHWQFTTDDARIKWDSVYPKFHFDNE